MSDPAEIVTSTLGGKTFPSCQFCAYHLEATIARLARRFPDDTLVVIQPPFNTTVVASAGTHDKCSAFDIQIVGMTWIAAQRFLRECGWAAWYRPKTPGLWGDHIHAVSLGCRGPKGDLIPSQIADYFAHRSGLKGHAPDPTWFPPDIDSTIFDFDRWEANMPLNADDLDKVEARAKKGAAEALAAATPALVDAVWSAIVRKETETLKELTARAAVRKGAES